MKVRSFAVIVTILISTLFVFRLYPESAQNIITRTMIATAEKLIGIRFTNSERDLMRDGLKDQLTNYENIRKVDVPNSVVPALVFNPHPQGFELPAGKDQFDIPTANVDLPANRDELAFYSVAKLASLIKNKKISSEDLARFFLTRLKKYDPKLKCVVTLTEELAIEQARAADKEIAAGKYRGILHGIPYGLKDLLSTKGIRTTWGSVPYKDQVLDVDSTVYQKLRSSGAVLVAKLSLGELAWGDVWFDGMTRNPWNLKDGSSGSSAGSASATSAGLVPFAIGSETWGSIVSPATRCGVTGLRPTFGRVSRYGAMALSWSMDKVGPICRTVDDCAIVFNEIRGSDGMDPAVINAPFRYSDSDPDFKKIRLAYLKTDFQKEKSKNDEASIQKLRSLGYEIVEFELPKMPVYDLSIILNAETAAAFDELVRTNKDDLLVRQIKDAWPNVFRMSRFIPAAEYIQANRVRTLLIQEMHEKMKQFDVYLAPSLEGDNSLLTNLTGHPCVVVPNGFNDKGSPTSITFNGHLYREDQVLAVARAYQNATDFHNRRPPGF